MKEAEACSASCGLLYRGFHVGGAHHHLSLSIQNDTLPRTFVQEQHLALTGHHILVWQRYLSACTQEDTALNGRSTVVHLYADLTTSS